LAVALLQQLAGFGIDDILGQHPAVEVLRRHFQVVDAIDLQLADMARGDTAALFDDNLATLALDVEAGDFAPQPLGLQEHGVGAFALLLEYRDFEKGAENLLGVVAQGPQQNGGGQLSAPIDADKDLVLGVELEIQPGTAIGNDPRRVKQLAGGVGLALVVVEEHAGGPVQLG